METAGNLLIFQNTLITNYSHLYHIHRNHYEESTVIRKVWKM